MATYIPGVTDYIPQIQPFRPDYNFLGNMLQARQSRYDTNYKALNDQYGTLLYSSMLKDSHNSQRDEFFKIINQDIKKMSSMDLSLQKNVDAATRVFDSFYKNKYLVDDMVKTKKFQSELSRGEAFKNCPDPDKCGGKFWQDGIDYLQYKAQEYKNSNDEDGYNMEMPSYTPKSNWKEKALKYAKENDYNVSMDHVTNDWIIHEKNGRLVQGGLRALFAEVYGDDPLVNENYNILSYNTGKRYVEANAPKVGLEKAEQDWISLALNAGNEKVNKDIKKVGSAYDEVSANINAYNLRNKTQGLSPDEIKTINELEQKKQKLNSVNKNLEVIKSSITPKDKNLASLRSSAQASYAQYLLNQDLDEIAYTASLRNSELKYDVNPFGLQTKMALLNHELDLKKISAELQAKISFKEYETMVDNGMLDGISGINQNPTITENKEYLTSKVDLEDEPYAVYNASAEEISNATARSNSSTSKFLYDAYRVAFNAAKDPKNVGAKNYLNELYGDNWNKLIEEKNFMEAVSKGTLYDKFKTTINFMDPKNTDRNNIWASKFIKDSFANGVIDNIKMNERARMNLLKKHVEVDKQIVNDIAKLGKNKDTPYYKDAKLLLSNNGLALLGDDMPTDFYYNFLKEHGRVINGKVYQQEGDKEAAEEVYDTLRDKFIEIYNKSKNISLSQGIGFNGGDMFIGHDVRVDGGDAAKFKSVLTNTAREYTDMVLTDGGKMKFMFGEPTKENYDDASNDDQENITEFFKVFHAGIRKPWLRGKKGETAESDFNTRPQWGMTESSVAVNDRNKRAVTFHLNPEYYSHLIGSKNKPGIFWNIKDKIDQGITMVYDKNELQGPMDRNMLADAYEEIIKTEGYKYENPNAGTIEFNFDKSTGNYYLDKQLLKFNPVTGEEYYESLTQPLKPNFKPTISTHNEILNMLKNTADANERMRAYIRQAYKNKNNNM